MPRGADQRAAIEPLALARVEVEQPDVHQHFDAAFAKRLALLHRGDAGEFLLPLEQQPRRTLEHARALLCRRVAPDAEALGGDFERAVEIARVGQRQFAQRFAARRVDHPVRPPPAAGYALAGDDHVE